MYLEILYDIDEIDITAWYQIERPVGNSIPERAF